VRWERGWLVLTEAAQAACQWGLEGVVGGELPELPELPGYEKWQEVRRREPFQLKLDSFRCLTPVGASRTISRIFLTAALPTASDPTSLDSIDRRGFRIHDG